MSGRTLLIVGFFLVLLGMVLPFLIVMKVLESTLWLNFFAFASSISGLFMGMIGAVYYIRRYRSKD